jgi:hypothetical protein
LKSLLKATLFGESACKPNRIPGVHLRELPPKQGGEKGGEDDSGQEKNFSD